MESHKGEASGVNSSGVEAEVRQEKATISTHEGKRHTTTTTENKRERLNRCVSDAFTVPHTDTVSGRTNTSHTLPHSSDSFNFVIAVFLFCLLLPLRISSLCRLSVPVRPSVGHPAAVTSHESEVCPPVTCRIRTHTQHQSEMIHRYSISMRHNCRPLRCS